MRVSTLKLLTSSRIICSITDNYQEIVRNTDEQASVNVITTGFADFIINLSKTMLVQVNQQYLVGATVLDGNTITAWFNNQAFHTAPLSVALVHNAIIRARLGESYGIDLINDPMQYTPESRLLMIQQGGTMGFQLSINVGFAMAFVAAFYIIAYIKVKTISYLYLLIINYLFYARS